ncbi:MAG: hypothetical protein WCL18_08375 [bacterium]
MPPFILLLLSYIITSPPTHASIGQVMLSVMLVVVVVGASSLMVKRLSDILVMNALVPPLLINEVDQNFTVASNSQTIYVYH